MWKDKLVMDMGVVSNVGKYASVFGSISSCDFMDKVIYVVVILGIMYWILLRDD